MIGFKLPMPYVRMMETDLILFCIAVREEIKDRNTIKVQHREPKQAVQNRWSVTYGLFLDV